MRRSFESMVRSGLRHKTKRRRTKSSCTVEEAHLPGFYRKRSAEPDHRKKKLAQQEGQLRELICDSYGIDTYREMMQLRRELKAKREKQMYAARKRRDAFLSCLVGSAVLGIGIAIIAAVVSFAL